MGTRQSILGITLTIGLSACSEADLGEHRVRPDPVPSTEPSEDTTTSTPPIETSTTSTMDPFLAESLPWLTELADPASRCLPEVVNSWYPVFHGCTDWHSAVHAAWALHAVTRLTGDPSFLAVADNVMLPERLDLLLVDLQAGALWFEVPYGFSWFLALAVERGEAGYSDLEPLAEVVAGDLRAHVEGLGPNQIGPEVTADQYDNLSWVVLNLWRYGQHVGDAELVDWAEGYTRDELLPRAVVCPIDDDLPPGDEFFPPCLHLAMTLLTILPNETGDYLASLPADYPIAPIVNITSTHQAGLNFSRSWGLHALWQATGDEDYRLASQDHIRVHYGMPAYWSQNEALYAHWVPQFGIYGIALWQDALTP